MVGAHGMGQLLSRIPFPFKKQLKIIPAAAQVMTPLLVYKGVIKADAITLRIYMELTDSIRLVARLSKYPGHCGKLILHGKGFFKYSVPMCSSRSSGHQLPPGRYAGRRCRVGPGITDSGVSKNIQGGSEYMFMSCGT